MLSSKGSPTMAQEFKELNQDQETHPVPQIGFGAQGQEQELNVQGQEETSKRIDRSEKNLVRQLEWVSRADNRCTLLAAISLGAMGFIANVTPKLVQYQGWMIWILLLYGFSSLSTIFFIRSVLNPNLRPPESKIKSLIFFGDIKDKSLDEFKKEFLCQNEDEYLDDLLGQVHRNSEIIFAKFENIKKSTVWFGISLIFWCVLLFSFIGIEK